MAMPVMAAAEVHRRGDVAVADGRLNSMANLQGAALVKVRQPADCNFYFDLNTQLMYIDPVGKGLGTKAKHYGGVSVHRECPCVDSKPGSAQYITLNSLSDYFVGQSGAQVQHQFVVKENKAYCRLLGVQARNGRQYQHVDFRVFRCFRTDTNQLPQQYGVKWDVDAPATKSALRFDRSHGVIHPLVRVQLVEPMLINQNDDHAFLPFFDNVEWMLCNILCMVDVSQLQLIAAGEYEEPSIDDDLERIAVDALRLYAQDGADIDDACIAWEMACWMRKHCANSASVSNCDSDDDDEDGRDLRTLLAKARAAVDGHLDSITPDAPTAWSMRVATDALEYLRQHGHLDDALRVPEVRALFDEYTPSDSSASSLSSSSSSQCASSADDTSDPPSLLSSSLSVTSGVSDSLDREAASTAHAYSAPPAGRHQADRDKVVVKAALEHRRLCLVQARVKEFTTHAEYEQLVRSRGSDVVRAVGKLLGVSEDGLRASTAAAASLDVVLFSMHALDKAAWAELYGMPLELPSRAGSPPLHLLLEELFDDRELQLELDPHVRSQRVAQPAVEPASGALRLRLCPAPMSVRSRHSGLLALPRTDGKQQLLSASGAAAAPASRSHSSSPPQLLYSSSDDAAEPSPGSEPAAVPLTHLPSSLADTFVNATVQCMGFVHEPASSRDAEPRRCYNRRFPPSTSLPNSPMWCRAHIAQAHMFRSVLTSLQKAALQARSANCDVHVDIDIGVTGCEAVDISKGSSASLPSWWRRSFRSSVESDLPKHFIFEEAIP